MGVVRIMRHFYIFPNHIFGVGEVRHFECRVLIDTEVY